MKLVSVEEMRAIEQSANAAGITNEKMMQKAGQELADFVLHRFSDANHVVGLVGKGNNGGDALVAMLHLLKAGWRALAVCASPRLNDPLMDSFVAAGGGVLHLLDQNFEGQLKKQLTPQSLVLDGLLGTGIQLPLRSEMSLFLTAVSKAMSGQKVVAVDCPSGVDCNSGAVAPETLSADCTVCMEAVKLGLVSEPAFAYCGELVTVPLGLPKTVLGKGNGQGVVDSDWVQALLPKRSAFSHKGTFGKVMVVGGSVNYCGAPLLAGMAAYRTGSGLVTLAVPHPVAAQMAGSAPEITWVILDEMDGVIAETAAELLARKAAGESCLVIGPGIGQEETTQRFLEKLLFPQDSAAQRKVGFLEGSNPAKLKSQPLPPLVLDADALRWLGAQPGWPQKVTSAAVLTPHPGEMSALTGLAAAEIQKDRIGVAKTFAQQWGRVVVLKGALTVIAAPDGRMSLIPVASSALAKAGSGDVLTGMIASLIGQGLPLFEAASCACWVHAQAGLLAAHRLGNEASVLARDLIDAIPAVLHSLN